jgi:hypothetical protein
MFDDGTHSEGWQEIKRANEQQRIKESLSPFENAFQISTHWRDKKSHDHNEGSRLKSIGVHLIAAYEDSTAAVCCRELPFKSGRLRPS